MASEEQWLYYTGAQMSNGSPTGDALHAQKCRDTPLEAKAILDLVTANLHYYGDSYYSPLTTPIDYRIAEFYQSIGETGGGG